MYVIDIRDVSKILIHMYKALSTTIFFNDSLVTYDHVETKDGNSFNFIKINYCSLIFTTRGQKQKRHWLLEKKHTC